MRLPKVVFEKNSATPSNLKKAKLPLICSEWGMEGLSPHYSIADFPILVTTWAARSYNKEKTFDQNPVLRKLDERKPSYLQRAGAEGDSSSSWASIRNVVFDKYSTRRK